MKEPILNKTLFLISIGLFLIESFSSCSFKKTTFNGTRLKNFPAEILIDSLLNNNVNFTSIKNKANATVLYEKEKKQIKINDFY